MSEAEDIQDDFIYHALQQERYKTGQGYKIKGIIKRLNKTIADYLLSKRTVETKKDYANTTRWVKERCKSFVEYMLKEIERDIRGQYQAETEWIKGALPDQINNLPDEDKVITKLFFNSFSDNDTIQSYFRRLGERIYKIWDSQLRIALVSSQPMTWVIKQVLGE